jgi:hypothetical protein
MDVVGFEVFTAMVMKSIIFWDMTPCSPLSFNLRFGGTYRLQLQGRRDKFRKIQQVRRWQAESFLLDLFLLPWRWRQYVSPKSRLKLNGLNGVIFQKTLLHAGFGWTHFFHPEDGGDMFLRNVDFGPKEVATKFKNLRNSWTTPQHHTLAPILPLRR